MTLLQPELFSPVPKSREPGEPELTPRGSHMRTPSSRFPPSLVRRTEREGGETNRREPGVRTGTSGGTSGAIRSWHAERAELQAQLADASRQIDRLQPTVDHLQQIRDEARLRLIERVALHRVARLDYYSQLLPAYEDFRIASYDLYRPQSELNGLLTWRNGLLHELTLINAAIEHADRRR